MLSVPLNATSRKSQKLILSNKSQSFPIAKIISRKTQKNHQSAKLNSRKNLVPHGYVPLPSPNPYPVIVYSVANYRPHVSHIWANIPQIPTCRNLLTPEIPQICDPILVNLLAPIENATPL